MGLKEIVDVSKPMRNEDVKVNARVYFDFDSGSLASVIVMWYFLYRACAFSVLQSFTVFPMLLTSARGAVMFDTYDIETCHN